MSSHTGTLTLRSLKLIEEMLNGDITIYQPDTPSEKKKAIVGGFVLIIRLYTICLSI